MLRFTPDQGTHSHVLPPPCSPLDSELSHCTAQTAPCAPASVKPLGPDPLPGASSVKRKSRVPPCPACNCAFWGSGGTASAHLGTGVYLILAFYHFPALKATQTELLELRRKYDEEAASK